jgi:hypothetical protein
MSYQHNIRGLGNGGLTLDGTEEQPITVTCSKPVCSPGDWHQLEIGATSVDEYNVFNHVNIEYGGGSSYGQLRLYPEAAVTLNNVTFSDAGNSCDILLDPENSTLNESGTNTYTICE